MILPSPAPRVLLVDDHAPNLLALQAVLEPLVAELVCASSGEEALRRVDAEHFAVILMDVQMPGLDGYATMRLIRQHEHSRDVPVIFITAVHDQPEHTRRGYALGAIDYVTKPFDGEVLLAKVRALIGLWKRAQDDERRRYAERERLRDLFLGVVNHDLRSPLNTICMAVRSVGKATTLEESDRRSLERANRAATRMTRLVGDLLDLTRGELGGGIPIVRVPGDVAVMCRHVADDFEPRDANRPIALEVSGDLHGEWDADRLLQAISNLVGNALQHAEGGTVSIRAREEPGFVTVEVHNTGAAMPPSVLPTIFEPFRRGDDSAEGLGLGLYIVREIVRAHGGTVTVHSSDEEGTTFRVVLPRGAA